MTALHPVTWACAILQVMSLRPRFQAAAQQAQSESGSDDDIEAVKGMARLFAELGESYVGLLAQGNVQAETGKAHLHSGSSHRCYC